jgi:hypothetical protein
MMATTRKNRKPDMCIEGNQSKIPKTAPIAPKIAPKTAPIIPITAPNTPTIKPNNPPRIPIQKGNVIINKMRTSTEEFDDAFVVMWMAIFNYSIGQQ